MAIDPDILSLLVPSAPPEADIRFSLATVASLSPLDIRLDGATSPLGATCIVMGPMPGLSVDMRVGVLLVGRRVVVLGSPQLF
jgi:hypothetical protein